MDRFSGKSLVPIIAVAVLFAVFFGYKHLFPSEADRIKAQMNELALLMSKNRGENKIQTVNKLRQSVEFFTLPVQIDFTYREMTTRHLVAQSKQELNQSLAAAKFPYPWLEVNFQHEDVRVEGERAVSQSQARIDFENQSADRVYDLFAVKLHWQKLDGQWLIKTVDINHIDLNE